MSGKKLLSVLILIFVLIALPLTLLLVKQRQEIRKKAVEVGNLSIPNTIITNDPDTQRLNVYITAQQNVGYAKGTLTYDAIFFSGSDPVIIYGDNANKGRLFSSSMTTPGVVSFELGANNKNTPLTGAFVFISLVPKGAGGQTGQTTVSLSGQFTAMVANPVNANLSGSIPVTLNPVSGPTPTATPVPIVISGLTHNFNVAPNPTPNVTVTFNTNVAAGSSFVLTLPNGDKICPTGATLAGCTSFTDLFKNTTLRTAHSFVAGSLIPGNYSFTVYAAYPGNNASVVSQNGTFSVTGATPTATPGIVLPDKALWYSLLTIPAGAYNASYDLWSTITNQPGTDNKVNGFDYVRWLDLGGHF